MMKIGIIGTGMLGESVGLHLLDSGYDVTVFNRTMKKTEENKEEIFERLNLEKNRPLILTVRRLEERMGLENLISAVEILAKKNPKKN